MNIYTYILVYSSKYDTEFFYPSLVSWNTLHLQRVVCYIMLFHVHCFCNLITSLRAPNGFFWKSSLVKTWLNLAVSLAANAFAPF